MIWILDIRPKLGGVTKIFAQKRLNFEGFLNDFIIILFVGLHCNVRPNLSPSSLEMSIKLKILKICNTSEFGLDVQTPPN